MLCNLRPRVPRAHGTPDCSTMPTSKTCRPRTRTAIQIRMRRSATPPLSRPQGADPLAAARPLARRPELCAKQAHWLGASTAAAVAAGGMLPLQQGGCALAG
jgi:hypothetical protein